MKVRFVSVSSETEICHYINNETSPAVSGTFSWLFVNIYGHAIIGIAIVIGGTITNCLFIPISGSLV